MMRPAVPPSDVRSEALKLLSNGVYVLTTCGADTLHAAAVTWVSQVSFLPPLVLVALQRNSRLAEAVRRSHRFALNILSADQQAIAEQFFTHRTEPLTADKLAGQGFRLTNGRCPLLVEAMAWLECRLVAEPPCPGDHALMLGEVVGAGLRRTGQPMVLWATPWSYGGIPEQEQP
ncbi:MAG: flavin reductase family protein [Anaerolineae bacterium]